jgi:hypothetical protein
MEHERRRRRAEWQPDLFQPNPPVAAPSAMARTKLLGLLTGLLTEIALAAAASREEVRHEQDHR